MLFTEKVMENRGMSAVGIVIIIISLIAIAVAIYLVAGGTNFLPRASSVGTRARLMPGKRSCNGDTDCLIKNCEPPLVCPVNGESYQGKCVSGACQYETQF